jgi:predicted membrane channel-forming protein YqfA (hemolysin III family)
VWTHFSGFVIFLVLAGVVMQQLDWRTPSEALLFLAFFLTVECSMLSSTIFHAFNCHSPGTYVASTTAFARVPCVVCVVCRVVRVL